ncbi:uncharacterized protein LOC141852996 [Brevipalpus obovatus]|uniref:uncharacterized protein LOC141852996 n=1 Tax=Brevipalpus obovatus TaxID=246614 RepID=UPI003D9F5D29
MGSWLKLIRISGVKSVGEIEYLCVCVENMKNEVEDGDKDVAKIVNSEQKRYQKFGRKRNEEAHELVGLSIDKLVILCERKWKKKPEFDKERGYFLGKRSKQKMNDTQ